MVQIKIINPSNNPRPQYSTIGSAGLDLRSDIDIVIPGREKAIVTTGLYIELPEGYEAQVRPRSGLAFNHGITVLNTPGTIDCDYRGEIKVLLFNTEPTPFEIRKGDRICQIVINKYEKAELISVSELDNTERGVGGIGHTGIK